MHEIAINLNRIDINELLIEFLLSTLNYLYHHGHACNINATGSSHYYLNALFKVIQSG